MAYLQRSVILVALTALLISGGTLLAQDDSVTVAGSAIALPLIEQLHEASESEVALGVDSNGTRAGMAALCAGEVDAAGATRPISIDEDANCAVNEVEYVELLLAHNVLAFISQQDETLPVCVDATALSIILAPSSDGISNTWGDISGTDNDAAMALILPEDGALNYDLLDSAVIGVGLRADTTYLADDDAISKTVSETEGALGVVSLQSAIASDYAIQVLDVQFPETSAEGCTSPSAENVEGRFYGIAEPIFLYVNRNSLPVMQDFLAFAASDAAAEAVATAGFTAPSAGAYETNQIALSGEESGRAFSQDAIMYVPPQVLIEPITVSGSGTGVTMLKTITEQFKAQQEQQQQQQLMTQYMVGGQAIGYQRLCSGDADVIGVVGDVPADALAECETAGIETLSINMGSEAVVLVANAEDDFAACLTTDQISTIWSAESTGAVSGWGDVDSSFPSQDMTLFGMASGAAETDLLLARPGMPTAPVREDTEQNRDPLYRAAATANVPGALTYMKWTDYQDVLANDQANIQLVSVDGGSGCVEPSSDTILDGSYPLSQAASLLVSSAAMANTTVQSALWQLFSDSYFSEFERQGLIGLNLADMARVRGELQRGYTLAEEAAAAAEQAAAEATAEPEAAE